MKKRRVNWLTIIETVLLAALLVLCVFMYRELTELKSQVEYLQDSTSIILTDVGGLETNIAQTLQAETGLVEDYTIEITDMNFAAGTYDVAISVIPKEYTDSTKLSVFFGTRECPLEKNGYEYTGAATLPLEEDFGGNLTFLFADGKKKNTEVYSNYSGVQNKLDEVLYGKMTAAPKYRDGVLTLTDSVEYVLDGVGMYEFNSVELVAEFGEEEVFCRDLMVQEDEDAAGGSPLGGVEDTEAASSAIGLYPTSDMGGKASLDFSCEPKEAGELRVFLRALSTDGYRFEYDLFRCTLSEEEAGEEPVLGLEGESFDWEPAYVVYDRRGGKLVLE